MMTNDFLRVYSQGRQSKCKSGKAQRYSYEGYKTTLAAAKGSLI